jgi:polyisoprenoid-binding protein YceI
MNFTDFFDYGNFYDETLNFLQKEEHMKRLITFAVLFAGVLIAISNFSARATDRTFAERFSCGEQIQQEDASGTYNFDKAHSFIGFRVKHMGLIEVPGYFREFTGTVIYDAKAITQSSVEFTAKTNSVDTGVVPRDTHLRTDDFFAVEKYPDMTFKSTKITKLGKILTVTGDLTIRDVTKPISFPFQIAGILGDGKGSSKMGLTAETVINRRDFGVNYGTKLPSGVPVLADNVKIVLQIEANRPQPKPEATPQP